MVSEEELKSFMLAMRKRYDLDFTNYEPKSLARGLQRILSKNGMDGMMDLWGKILKEDDFFLNSIDDLMVNLTELFRNPEAWVRIKNEILCQFQKHDELKVWHAGCSTGEEVITMAIVLEDAGLFHKVSSLATDLSSSALATARKGSYSVNAMKNYEKAFKKYDPLKRFKDYFTISENYGRISPYYLSKTRFERDNLVDLNDHGTFDIIFCRNVLIYFDNKLKAEILAHLESRLNEGGYLILGYYDTMPNQSIDIFKVHDNSVRIYQKK
ncbi:MAG: protein-glutamate O-methyltransferase CheR, partial [Ekhidna sp.]|nr:protein-glutamate O-methyltransferase CheR [Ekhidna sp.]